MQTSRKTPYDLLDEAHQYALKYSGCTKVAVGSIIASQEGALIYGANRTIPDWCKTRGCHRVEVYGDNSKDHRGPADCRAVHSEIDAICNMASIEECTYDSSIYVTRYPCEACARAIVAAGIKHVYYGRQQEISDETKLIFATAGVEIVWVKTWMAEDVLT